MAAQSSGQPLQTSDSLSSASSSLEDHRSSLLNGHTGQSNTDTASLGQKNKAAFGYNSTVGAKQVFLPQRKHGQRSSGGFLLETLPSNITDSSSLQATEAGLSGKAKGKRKVEDGELLIPKRANARQAHRPRSSVGSSPLATDVSNTLSVEGPNDMLHKRSALTTSQGGQSGRSSFNSNDTSAASVPSTSGDQQRKRQNAIGNDMDASQIVNLALNLSESRRRNFSGGSLLATRDSIGAKRIISSGRHSLGTSNSPTGASLRQYLNEQRRISRNVSPRTERSLSKKGISPQFSQVTQNEKRRASALPDFRAGRNEDIVFNASDATLARAEKARVVLELSYEHRRLLQWLPKLPTPSQPRHNVNKGGGPPYHGSAEHLGRTYNPLQYIRNRKVRFKEDKPIDSEAQGWTNVDKVREWVETVIDEREEGISRIDKRFPLPPFEPAELIVNSSDDKLISGVTSVQEKKVSRPHTIWEFSPQDLLADVYWLNQDDNELRIENSHGKKLAVDERSVQEDRPRKSKESTRGPIRHAENIFRLSKSDEKAPESSERYRSDSRDRDWRRRREAHEPRSPASDGNVSQTRKSRWPRKFVRSRSPSSSGDSEQDKRSTHVRGLGHRTRADYDNAALEKHMMDVLTREAEDSDEGARRMDEQTAMKAESERATLERNSKPEEQIPKTIKRRPNAPQRLQTDMPTAKKHQDPARASLDEQRFQHYRMSSDDFDSTAPNSPTSSTYVPSIAINLSPSESPAASTMPDKKPLPGGLGSFRRSRSTNRRKLAAVDDEIALESGASTDLSRQNTDDSQLVGMLRKERSSDPSNGLLSPIKSDYLSRTSRPFGENSFRNIKNTNPLDSRFRGFLKGGRIAELVGTEVSKVGDKLWRKDNGSSIVQAKSPSASNYASDESDVDDGDISGLDNSPEDNLSRTVSRADGQVGSPQTSLYGSKPKYHMDNLPVFRSAMNRDDTYKTHTSLPSHDHISRQQMALRENGRPSRFDRLAPPKIDVRGTSPSPSRTSSPDNVKIESRRSSSSTSNSRVRNADRRLNEMLDVPGKVGTGMVGPTGLAAFSSRQPRRHGRPLLDGRRQWSMSHEGVSVAHGPITKRDIARVRALLLSSGIKANEIVRRAEETPEQPALYLQQMQDIFPTQIPAVPRSQGYALARRALVKRVEMTTRHVKEAAEQFSRKDVESLHRQIKTIDDHVNETLTPLVRATADDADRFSMELTTTHTLAVKQLNDSVDLILRRRRRRLRWLRRWGWAFLEWTLLTIMWLVWLLVVIIRFVRGTTQVLIGGIRWLFWL